MLLRESYGTVQHEMLHALGFYHEHSSTERDDYVIISWDNIQDGKKQNLGLYSCSCHNMEFALLDRH